VRPEFSILFSGLKADTEHGQKSANGKAPGDIRHEEFNNKSP
jgi:hypothetical protein